MNITYPSRNKTSDKCVTPNEFLEWAKEDLKSNDKRAIGNGLGNIKKAIHCRIDEIIDNTHVKYCKGWNQLANTDTKLELLGILNIQFNAVVSLLTDIRNTYEHNYRLPSLKQALAYLDIADMWLKISYKEYAFYPVAIAGLKMKTYQVKSTDSTGSKLIQFEIDGNPNVDYLWTSKKEIHEIKNGKLTIIPMKDFEWKNMAKFEAKHLVFTGTPNRNIVGFRPTELTRIYKQVVKLLVP